MGGISGFTGENAWGSLAEKVLKKPVKAMPRKFGQQPKMLAMVGAGKYDAPDCDMNELQVKVERALEK